MIPWVVDALVMIGVAALLGVSVGLCWIQAGPPPWWIVRQEHRMRANFDDPGDLSAFPAPDTMESSG